MQIMIPLTTIKLILLTAVLWSAVSIVTVIALCSIGEMGSFNVVLRPAWLLIALLLVLWVCSFKVISYGMFDRGTFYTPLK